MDQPIVIGPVTIYIETDKDGYKGITTDAMYPISNPAYEEAFERIITSLRSVQTDDDRESEAVMREWLSRRR